MIASLIAECRPGTPKLQDFHGRRQQRESEGNRNPSGPCPKPKRQSRSGKAISEKMLDHAWQAGVGAISARNERQTDNGQNAEEACCPNNGEGKCHEPNLFPFTRLTYNLLRLLDKSNDAIRQTACQRPGADPVQEPK